MRLRTVAIAGTMAIVASVIPGAAQAVGPTFLHLGYAGGTKVTAVGLTVTSDLTAESQVSGAGNVSQTNQTANVVVSGLLNVGAVTTSAVGSTFGDGSKVVTHAHTATISLLNGLIRASAIDTTATASGSSTSAPAAGSQTTILGLVIAGKSYPTTFAPNTAITIPGIATVMLNFQASAATADGAATIGGGLVVKLLAARSGAAAGASLVLDPVYAAVNKSPTAGPGAPVGGGAYGSYIHAVVNGVAKVESSPTAPTYIPSYGTYGNTISNSTANVNLIGAMYLGAVSTNGSGIQSLSLSDATETASITKLNLFNGLIMADAIGTTSHTRLLGGPTGTRTREGSLTFVNLRIAGQLIPLNVAPNTTIHVANLGTVTINEQYGGTTSQVILERVIGLHIVLDTSRAGLPVGASVEIATSAAAIYG